MPERTTAIYRKLPIKQEGSHPYGMKKPSRPPKGWLPGFCDPARIRTWDPQLRRLLLCPTELRDLCAKIKKKILL